MSVLAALEALLDSFFVGDHYLFAVPVNGKHSGNSDDGYSARDRAAVDVAVAATHFISDVTRGVFRSVVENLHAQANAVAERALRNGRDVRGSPRLRGFGRRGGILRGAEGIRIS